MGCYDALPFHALNKLRAIMHKNQIKHSLVTFIFFSWLSVQALAQSITPPPSGFTFQKIEANEVIRNPTPRGPSTLGPGIFKVRGVILQNSASFIHKNTFLDISKILLKWVNGTENTNRLCISHNKICTTLNLPEEVIFRVAYWVATSNSTVAFTLLPKFDPLFQSDRKTLIDSGYITPTVNYSYPKIFSDGSVALQHRSPSASSSVLVHPALDDEFILSALSYIDFSDGSQKAPRTEFILQRFKEADRVIKRINQNGDKNADVEPGNNIRLLDSSYTNTDVDASFIIQISQRVIKGEPLRYFWDRVAELIKPRFRDVWKFRSIPDLLDGTDPVIRKRHSDAMQLAQLTAALRAFQSDRPAELARFVNEGLELRRAD